MPVIFTQFLTIKPTIMKRIRYNGKSLSKFDMAYIMGYWHNLPWTVMCDAFDYAYMAARFNEFLSDKVK